MSGGADNGLRKIRKGTVKGHNCSPPKKKIGRLGLHTVFVLLSAVYTQLINN